MISSYGPVFLIRGFVVRTQNIILLRGIYFLIYKLSQRAGVEWIKYFHSKNIVSIQLKESSFGKNTSYGISDIDLYVVVGNIVDKKSHAEYEKILETTYKVNRCIKFLDIQVWQRDAFLARYFANNGKYSEIRDFTCLFGENFKLHNLLNKEIIKVVALADGVRFLIISLFKNAMLEKQTLFLCMQQQRAFNKLMGKFEVFHEESKKLKFEELYLAASDRLDAIIMDYQSHERRTVPGNCLSILTLNKEKNDPSLWVIEQVDQKLQQIPEELKSSIKTIILSEAACANYRYCLYIILKDGKSLGGEFLKDGLVLRSFFELQSKKRYTHEHLDTYIFTENVFTFHLKGQAWPGAPWEDCFLHQHAIVFFGNFDQNIITLPTYDELVRRISVFIYWIEQRLYELLFENFRDSFINSKSAWTNSVYAILPACKLLVTKKILVTTPREAIKEYMDSDFADKRQLSEILDKYIFSDMIPKCEPNEFKLFLREISPLVFEWIKQIKNEL